MMGLGRDDANNMNLWEYEARLWHWNDAHGGDDDDGGERPDPAAMQRMIDRINSDPLLNPPG